MTQVDEIAPDVYRICVLYPEINLQFCHFLIKDEEPLLFHTGLRRMFREVREGVARVIDPAQLRWISWSHFESDECGSLNDWLAIAPRKRWRLWMAAPSVFQKTSNRCLFPFSPTEWCPMRITPQP